VRHIPVDIIYGIVIVKARCQLERCQDENNDARGMHCGLKVERKNLILVLVFMEIHDINGRSRWFIPY
jgi:hypothetical protein